MKNSMLSKLVSIFGLAVALAVWCAPAPVMATMLNEVYNGGFDNGAVGWPTGNTTHNFAGASNVDGHATVLDSNVGSLSRNNYTIVDAAHLGDGALYTQQNSLNQPTAAEPANELGSLNPNWVSGATSETYTFSFQYYDLLTTNHADVQLYAYTGTGTPPYNVNSNANLFQPLGTSSPNWTLIYDSGTLGSTSGNWVDYTTTATLSGSPEYFGIVVSKSGSGSLDFDSMFLGLADPPAATPEPATMLLLGSGIVGLLGFKKRFNKA